MNNLNGFRAFSLEAQKEVFEFLRSVRAENAGFYECLQAIDDLPEHVQTNADVEAMREAFEKFTESKGFSLYADYDGLLLKASYYPNKCGIGRGVSYPLQKVLNWPLVLKAHKDAHKEYEEYLRLKKKYEPES